MPYITQLYVEGVRYGPSYGPGIEGGPILPSSGTACVRSGGRVVAEISGGRYRARGRDGSWQPWVAMDAKLPVWYLARHAPINLAIDR
jgi:hypothetical protein